MLCLEHPKIEDRTLTTYNSRTPNLPAIDTVSGKSPEQIFQDEVAYQLREQFGLQAKKNDRVVLIESLYSNLKRFQ